MATTEEQGKSKAVRNVINFFKNHVSRRYRNSFLLFRIQTGKLSEFLTTSCFAHLSFLDSGKPRSSSLSWSEDEDDEYSFSNKGTMHNLNISDGKEEQSQDKAPSFSCKLVV